MAYAVNFTVRAERDLALLFDDIGAEKSVAALRWYGRLKAAVLSLSDYPNRCAATPEDRRLRHLLHGRKPHVCRVIFRIDERRKCVDILHIRHGARQPFGPSEVE